MRSPLVLVLVLVALGCDAFALHPPGTPGIDVPGLPGDPGGPDDPPGTGTPVPASPDPESDFFPPDPAIIDACAPSTVRGAAHRSARKLMKRELLATVQDLFAPHNDYYVRHLRTELSYYYTPVAERLPMQVALNEYPEDVSTGSGEDFERAFRREQVEAWTAFVHELANLWVREEYAVSYTDGCLRAEQPDAACWSQYVAAFGRRVFRRPLEESEIASYAAMAAEAPDRARGDYLVFSRMLLSPHFLYQMERGRGEGESEGEAEGERVRVSDHEVAVRLAYALTGTMPDEELARAADAGELSTLDAVRAHADRLIRTERAQQKLMGFFIDWMRWHEIPQPHKWWGNAAMLPTGVDHLYNANGLHHDLRSEAEAFIRHIVWEREGTFEDLFTARIALPRNERVRMVYGASELSVDGAPVEAPHHPGLLARAAFFASATLAPSPIRRGVTVKMRVLCQAIPSPDFSIVASRQEGLAVLDPFEMPNHEIVSELTSPAACMTCHRHINPVGFLFEAYNPLGQWNDEEVVLIETWRLSGGERPPDLPQGVDHIPWVQHPLPGPQSLFIEEGLPDEFASSDELIEAIADSESARGCMSVRMFRHLTRRTEQPEDACSIADAFDATREGTVLDAFVSTVVNEDIFWRRP